MGIHSFSLFERKRIKKKQTNLQFDRQYSFVGIAHASYPLFLRTSDRRVKAGYCGTHKNAQFIMEKILSFSLPALIATKCRLGKPYQNKVSSTTARFFWLRSFLFAKSRLCLMRNFIKIKLAAPQNVSFGSTLFFSQRKGGRFFWSYFFFAQKRQVKAWIRRNVRGYRR